MSTLFGAGPSDEAGGGSETPSYPSVSSRESRSSYQRPPGHLDPASFDIEDLRTVARVVAQWRSLRDPIG
ncbi:hypothetical protein [Nocardia sp. NPDC058666]|uniref:hypothetical protein n=1 Tax=unclassified Nocardia TaxID=2637762 RepID=UPI0036658548